MSGSIASAATGTDRGETRPRSSFFVATSPSMLAGFAPAHCLKTRETTPRAAGRDKLHRSLLWLTALAATGLSGPLGAQAGASCPLPLTRQIEALHAFAEMMPVFRHPRCLNCHGGLDPTAEAHPGADALDPTESDDQCQLCHDGLKGWRVPGSLVFFVMKGDEELCLQMKRFESTGDEFVAHIFNDHGPENTQFIAAAFVGDRALGEQGLKDNDLVIEPPPGTQAELTEKARKWTEIVGDGYRTSPECGCVVRFDGTFTQTEETAYGATRRTYTISGRLVWTRDKNRPSSADGRTLRFSADQGEITVDAHSTMGGPVGGQCEYSGKKTFQIAGMPPGARRHLSLEIDENGRYELSLGMQSQYLEMQVEATCKVPNVNTRETLPLNDAAIQIGVRRGTLGDDGIVGKLATPIRRGPVTVNGSWSFGAVQP